MRKLLLVITFLLNINPIFAQNTTLDWVKSFGDDNNDVGNSIAIDKKGNVYTTGYFTGTVDFDPSEKVFYLTSKGGNDIFISKFDTNGNFVWAKQMGGSADDRANAIAIDDYGNVYTTGYFYGVADFDPSNDFFYLDSVSNYDAFISKLDINGNFVWAKSLGGKSNDVAFSLAVDKNGNVYTTGKFSETADFDPGENVFNLHAIDFDDIFVSKLDNNGNFVWAKSFGSTKYDVGNSITVDSNGNVYTTGFYAGIVDFDPSDKIFNLSSVGFSSDIFISKLDNNGNFVWAKSFGGKMHDVGNSIVVDSNGNVYTTGLYAGIADFDPSDNIFNLTTEGSTTGTFISKLNADGNFIWAKSFNSSSNDPIESNSMAMDKNDNIYTIGRFSGTIDFDPSDNIFNLNSFYSDIFISKLDVNGSFVWAKSIKNKAFIFGNSIAIDSDNNVFTTGCFYGITDFDPGEGEYNLVPKGGYDVFIHKMSQNVLGTYNNNYNNDFVVYPNPSKGIFVIKSQPKTSITYEIIDNAGKTVLKGTLLNNQNTIDLTNKVRGIYILKTSRKTTKLIKL